jgi:prostamide/prostaglandin F2alpha synthase
MSGEELSKRLEDVCVTRALDRSHVRLGDLWKEQGVLLCMFRRWGCGLCRISAVNISGLKPILDQNNIALVGIGLDWIGIDEFIDEEFFAGELFVDAEKRSYQALNCKANSWRNLWGLVSGVVRQLAQLAESKGYKSNNQGDFTQLGGTFLIEKGGRTVYRHFQTNDNFEPSLEMIVARIPGAQLPPCFELYPAYRPRKSKTDSCNCSVPAAAGM